MIVDILKMDHEGRGISYVDGKITFIENALPGELVEINITKETSKYNVAVVTNYIKNSENRIKSKCPYYESCGGCHLRHLSYDNTILYKKNKVKEILNKYAKLDIKIGVIKSKKEGYRNKIELKVKDRIIGFYKKGTHEIVEISRCLNCEDALNSFLIDVHLLNITNGEIIVKTNYNSELLINIKTEDEQNIEIEALCQKHRIVGIIYNDNLVYGSDNFIETINDTFFKESYDSFFQINRNINSELFKLINDNIAKNDIVLDLCSGVGTLSIVSSLKAKKVYGIEIVENAIKDALLNAKMNKRDNVNFILGDAFDKLKYICDANTYIIDPPRSGLNNNAITTILNKIPNKIIYVSCNPNTLARDLSLLKEKYEIIKLIIMDMFPYTYHVECVCLLSLKK